MNATLYFREYILFILSMPGCIVYLPQKISVSVDPRKVKQCFRKEVLEDIIKHQHLGQWPLCVR